MNAEDTPDPLPALTNGLAIVCIDAKPGRSTLTSDDILRLVASLGGTAIREDVSDTLFAIRATFDRAAAARFQSALALAGASFLTPMTGQSPVDIVILFHRDASLP